MTVSVVGLGRMGLPVAVAIASRGVPVIGVDTAKARVAALNGGPVPGPETGTDARLVELVAAHRDRLSGTRSHRDAVLASSTTLVVVPTPSDRDGGFSLEYAESAFAAIGRALATKSDYHLVVLVSTVMPGATRNRLLPILECESGASAGPGGRIGLCYSPIFAALGDVVDGFLAPDFALAGELDARAGDELTALYRAVLCTDPPIKRMTLESAEIAKLAVNTYVTTKITFGNLLADLCERVPYGDVDAVVDAVGADRRIGRAYLTGGLAYGGPCFPRDNGALACLARSVGVSAELPETVDRRNRALTAALLRSLAGRISDGTRVALIGLAYKPGTAVLDESAAVDLAWGLAGRGARVVAYDPLAAAPARALFGTSVRVADSVEECVRDAELVVLATPGPVPDLTTATLKAAASPVTVVDLWRRWPKLSEQDGVEYVPVGRWTPATRGLR